MGLLRWLGGVIAAGCESFRDEVQQNLSALKDVAFRKIITPVITKKKKKGKRADTKAKGKLETSVFILVLLQQ